MKKIAIIAALVLGSQAFAQEAKTIKELTERYDNVEFVLLSKSDTTAVVSRVNIPQDLGLDKEEEVFYTDNGKFTLFIHGPFRIVYGELFDGRTGTTISRL
jgi:hypothetical protein